MTTKTVTKKATAKTPAKPRAAKRTAAKPKAGAYAALLTAALAGKHGPQLARFYANAVAYHAKKKTVFPRERVAKHPLMDIKEATDFLAKHEKTSIPAGNMAGQRLFDEMMVEARA